MKKLCMHHFRRAAAAAVPAGAVLFAAAALCMGDDLIRISGRSLKPGEEKFVLETVKSLRESDHIRRFDNIDSLIRLDSLAVPFLLRELERGSNPIPGRCAILALSEIAPPEAVEQLSAILKGSKKGRDEKAVAALGLGKLAAGGEEADLLRRFTKRGEERLLRKSAALGLGRMGDAGSFKSLVTLASQERDERLAVTFLLAAAILKGDPFAAAAPDLLASLDGRRRRVVILGCAFHDEPALAAPLLKYGPRDEENAGALAVALGRARSGGAAEVLAAAVSGPDDRAAADAAYSLAAGFGEEASAVLIEAFKRAPRPSDRRNHVLLAAAEGGLSAAFAEPAARSLLDPDPAARSAAALALSSLGGPEATSTLLKALKGEKEARVAGDILIALGLRGAAQDAFEVDRLAESSPDAVIRDLAALVSKTMTGKTARAVLEKILEDRLDAMSGAWRYRFRDAFLEEVGYGMELDTIVRRIAVDSDDTGTTATGGDQGSELEGESGEAGESGSGEAAEETESTANPSSGSGTGGTRRAVVRGEVVEWDILHWFKELKYFPDGLFAMR